MDTTLILIKKCVAVIEFKQGWAGIDQPSNQCGGLALVYGGINTVVFGILIIWALVKSGQIESIDKNIKIIAEWAKSQKDKEGQSDDDEKFLEDEQRKLPSDT